MEKEKQKTERKEHILVCLSFSPSNEKIIRTAAQMARAFGANFTALYVQTAEPAEKTPEDQARLQKHIRLAEQSGAEIVTTHSEDIALQIAEYARISEVTRIVIGKSMMDQGFFRKRRGWTERLTDLVPDLEIHIIPDSNIITIYLVGVMMTSILTSGYTCSVISSVISVVLFNYFLTASDTVRVRFRLSGDLCHHAGHFHSDRYACIKIKRECKAVCAGCVPDENSFQYQPASAEGRGCVGDF